jgi:hypothetical protein
MHIFGSLGFVQRHFPWFWTFSAGIGLQMDSIFEAPGGVVRGFLGALGSKDATDGATGETGTVSISIEAL